MIPEIICVGREQGTGNGEQGRRNKSVLRFFQKSNMSPIYNKQNPNTCRLRAKGEGEKGQEKTFNPYPLTFSPNQTPS
ncbi:hypothetical protein FDUTEX481_02118 [Tolypothrix sp. PCC 7601]|nr:hypothetical protein FDUTEX481_02118 [Tolypothrix sp. PCC 7601]